MPNFASGLVQVSLILLSRPSRCFKKMSRVPFAYPTLIIADPFIFGALKSRRYSLYVFLSASITIKCLGESMFSRADLKLFPILLGVAYVVFSDVVVKAFVEPVDENNWNRRLDGNAINDTAQLFVIGFRNCLNSSGELFLERHKVVADYG
ncbi:uncharacterized protein TRIADDRAFT_62589 [Trichoplax adhaerens]|uniref:Uncharacterized protein n=1 Tax=Trichoplax adhaerens TaxID=10228 RepID=B3SE91_TRIAD|nr:predicted protein [Trichoplax adhaerens]EDV18954.1 predicted protein [Trichoplax adhaerens]|eukprot:XP_002118560.1 predicted protein [Trichoplax adhaerens]